MSGNYQTVTPMPAANYLATLGANTHIPYTNSLYANIPNDIADLNYLGINQVRDNISNGVGGSAPLASYIAMAQAGIHFTFMVDVATTSALTTMLGLIAQLETAVPGSVTAVEGPNEINNFPVDYNGVVGIQGALNEQSDIYQAVHSNAAMTGVPVDYFTGYGYGGIPLGPDPSTTAGLANYDTQHPYPNYGQAPAFWVSRHVALINTTNASEPAVYTETGYTTNQVDATVQAKYTLDLLFDTAQEGISKTYLYELLDKYAPGSAPGDSGYGLFDSNGNAKPVANAIHNLTTLLQDTGANATSFQPAALSYSVSGLPSTGNSMVLEKSNGTYVIAVWAEPQIWNNSSGTEIGAPTENVTVAFPSSYGSIQVFDPLTGTNAVASYSNQSSVNISVTDHPILIELNGGAAAPAAAPAAASASAAASSGLVLNMSEDAFQGDAQFTVSVDGTQIGGVQTVTASHAAGQSQAFSLGGSFGAGSHNVAINFLNDFNIGPGEDRNLYVGSIAINGYTTVENAAQYGDGAVNYAVVAQAGSAANAPASTVASTNVTNGVLQVSGGGSQTMNGVTGVSAVVINDSSPGGTPYNTNFTTDGTPGLVVYTGAGNDTITVGDASQGVVTSSATATVDATAAQAGVEISGQSAVTLDITTGGNAALNAVDTGLTVQMAAFGTLTLSKASFITAIGGGGNDTIIAEAAGQTLVGGAGVDTLVGFTGFGDVFKDTSGALNGDLLGYFGGNDVIDVTDLNFARASASYSGSSTDGSLSLTDGTNHTSMYLGDGGGFNNTAFTLSSDGHGGTNVMLR